MKRPSPELVVNLLLLAALLLGGLWFANNTHWVDVWKATPPRGEAARDPQFALKQLLASLGLRVVAPDNLDRLPPPGAALVLTSTQWDFVPGRAQRLREWVEQQGGHLVLAQFFSVGEDMAWVPIRASKRAQQDHEDEEDDDEIDGPAPAASTPPASAASAAQRARGLPREFMGPRYTPAHQCEPYAEVQVPEASPPQPTGRAFRLCGGSWADPIEPLPSARVVWRIDHPKGALALRVPLGKGRVTAVPVWGLLDNDGLFKGDHAQAIVALLDARAGKEVWFVADERREALWLWLWHRAGPAIGLLAAALAFALWRGMLRFGPLLPQAPLARRSVAEQIRGTAAFVLRGGGAPLLAAALRALESAARRCVPGFERMTLGERAAALATTTALPPDELVRALDPRLPIGRARALAERLALIETARRRLNYNPPLQKE